MSQAVTTQQKPELLMCILSYFGIFALIPYFVRKNDDYIQWHAKQGLVLAACMIVISVILSVLSMMPAVGFIASLASGLVGLASLGLSIFCMIQAIGGKQWRIPWHRRDR